MKNVQLKAVSIVSLYVLYTAGPTKCTVRETKVFAPAECDVL
jgi:hypothetical protein